MPRIVDDKSYASNVAQAVNFACKMMSDGTSLIRARTIACRYYRVEWRDVQSGISSRSGISQTGKHRNKKIKCKDCNGSAVWNMKVLNSYGQTVGHSYICDSCKQSWTEEKLTGLIEKWGIGHTIVFQKYNVTKS